MPRGHQDLVDWLDGPFFEKGAFITDAETGDIFLGKQGEVCEGMGIDSTKDAFYLKDFFQNKYLCYSPAHWHKTTLQELLMALAHIAEDVVVTQTKNFDNIYIQDFKKLKAAFETGLQKVVLVSREEFHVSDKIKARMTFIKKALTFGVGIPYGLWFDGYGVTGSTPELLLQIKKNILKTFALAGTARLGNESELLNSTKDKLEHELVVEDIMERLSPFCSLITSLPMKLMNYKDLIHLKTDISASLKPEADLEELTSSLSPTAALGGYPREASFEFIKSTNYSELYPDRYFGSAFGLHTKELNQFIVSIRNIQWKDELFIIESGGGVLPESLLEKELDEIKLKRDTIKRHYL